MEIRQWTMRSAPLPLLLLLVCFTLPVTAKTVPRASVKKGRMATATKAPKAPTIPSTKLPPVAHRAKGRVGKNKQNRATVSPAPLATNRRLTARADRGGSQRMTAPVLARPTRGKRSVVTKIAPSRPSRAGRHITVKRSTARFFHRRGRYRAGVALRKDMDSEGSAPAAHRLSGTEENESLDAAFPYSPDTAPFFARLNGERLPYRINSVFALPSEDFILSVGGPRKNNDYAIQTALSTTHLGPNVWSWRAPREVGLYLVKIFHPSWGATIQVNVFVLAPFSSIEHGYLNGYRVGKYPNEPYKQREAYALPRGFIEVTEANENTLVSPHFRLRQFLCKQQGDYPKYIILDPRLLQALETILKKVNEQGYSCHTLSIMSGYRTPYYNRAIGNSTAYSRHLWGDAADLFIDANPRDGEMDDLNADGVVNVRDAEVLYDLVYDLYGGPTQRYLAGSFFQELGLQRLLTKSVLDMSSMQRLLTGGLARYRENGAHGPFVHVDVRGVFTSWRQ